ncbi:MAG: hypothetical protein AAGA48_25250, partial [Myxococcota bacterium]
MNRVFYVLVMAAFAIAGIKYFADPEPLPLSESSRDQIIAAVDASPDRTPAAVATIVLSELDAMETTMASQIEARGGLSVPLADALRNDLAKSYAITGAEAATALARSGQFAYGGPNDTLDDAFRTQLVAQVDEMDASTPRAVARTVVEAVTQVGGPELVGVLERR